MKRQFNINSILRENIKRIKPYSSARDEFTGEASVFLDANENPIGSVGGTKNNRYPDPYQRELKAVISKIKGIAPEHIFLGNGSDEAIDLLFKSFCRPGIDAAIQISPSYGMYKVSADVNEVNIHELSLDENYQPNADALIYHGFENVKILFLCSPNNPTGNILDRTILYQLLDNFNGMVVIDEAYIDFSNTTSWIAEIKNYPNLVVLQTLSKAWGLANLRVGMLFASTELITVLNKIKLPYNISGVAQDYALNALSNVAEKDAMVAEILSQRTFLLEELKTIPCVLHIYPTDANFVLVKTTDPDAIYTFLTDNKIVVRNRNRIHLCEGSLRLTIGTKEENVALLNALRNYK
jgi:histidinol-phosphate aminotransferase